MKHGTRTLILLLILISLLMSLSACGKNKRPQIGSPTLPQETQQPTIPAQTELQELPLITEPPVIDIPPEETQPQERSYILTLAGDCVLGSSSWLYSAPLGFVQTVGTQYDYPFRNVTEYFENDDLTLLSLESPLTDTGFTASESDTYRGPAAYIDILTQGSVEAVSIANNHILDYGSTGLNSTTRLLQDADISYVGRDSSVIISLDDGLKVGIYGSVYYMMSKSTVSAGISSLKTQGADIIIFAPHWGLEEQYVPTMEQRDLAHAAIEAGAHIVWGTHPQVLQPIESYKNGLIFYSLGAFSFGANTVPGDFDTALVQLELIRSSDGTVRLGDFTVIPASISSQEKINNYQPTPYSPDDQGYRRVMQKMGLS